MHSDLLSRPRYRRHGDPEFEAIRVGRKDKSIGQAPFLFLTGPWRGETVWVDPRKMQRHLSVARKHHLCSAWAQLIVPGELYRDQWWAPWQGEDNDGYWYHAPACRWCAEHYWKDTLKDDTAERVWGDNEVWTWVEEQPVRYLKGFQECWEVPIPGWSGCQLVDEVHQPLRAAQKAARATWEQSRGKPTLVAFYRAIGVDPWEEWTPESRWNRVKTCTPAGFLYRCGLRRPHGGGLDRLPNAALLLGWEGFQEWRVVVF